MLIEKFSIKSNKNKYYNLVQLNWNVLWNSFLVLQETEGEHNF